MRRGEHGMEIAGSQEFALAGRQPALAGLRLTLGAVPIATRVVGDGLISATLASVAMPAEGSGAAALNGPKGFELLKVKARPIPIQEAIAVCAQSGHTVHRSAGCYLTLLQQVGLIASQLIRPELIRGFVKMASERGHVLQVLARRDLGVVAALEFLQHHLA